MPHIPPEPGPRDSPTRIIAINEEWLSFLMGYIQPLLRIDSWVGTPEEIDTAIERVRQMMDYTLCNIAGISVSATGTIVIEFADETTVETEEIFITNIEYNPSNYTWSFYVGDEQTTVNIAGNTINEWIPPTEPAIDQYCYAAHFVIDQFSDQFQDILQIIDVGLNETSQLLQLVGIVPVAGSVAESAIEFIHQGLLQPVLNWALQNVYDLDAQFTAKEALYCAMLQATNNYADIWDYIDFPPSLPEIIIDTVTSPAEWQNVKDVLEWAYNILEGSEMGWVILRYIQFIDQVFAKVGLADGMSAMIGHAMNYATLYTVPDCSMYDCQPLPQWEYSWNTTCHRLGWSLGSYGSWVSGDPCGWEGTSYQGLYNIIQVASKTIYANAENPKQIDDIVWLFKVTGTSLAIDTGVTIWRKSDNQIIYATENKHPVGTGDVWASDNTDILIEEDVYISLYANYPPNRLHDVRLVYLNCETD
jgi:hypothetical protein